MMSSKRLLLHNLPDDVLEHVFAFLPLSDRKSASLVCRLWSELAFSRRFLSNVTLQLFRKMKNYQSNYLQRSTRRYRNVIVFFESKACQKAEYGFIIKIMNMFGAELESFHCMVNFSEEQLWNVIARAPQLKQLIVGLDGTTVQQFTFPKLRYLQDLGSLTNVLRIQSLDAPNLRQLTAIFTNLTDARESTALLRRQAPQLKNLELYSTEYFIPIEELQFPKVETLALRERICATNSDALRTFFKGFVSLREVILGFNVGASDLDVITKTCSSIERLSFKFSAVIPNLFCLLGRLRRLKTLWLHGVIDSKITLDCKPLVSVQRLVFQVSKLSGEASVIRGFRQILPNVTDMNVTLATLSNNDRRNLQVLAQVCANFSNLKRLTILYADYCMMRCRLSEALNHLYQLEELTFNHIITNKPMEFMWPKRTLKRLRFQNYPYLTDEDLLLMAEVYPNLKYLELAWCKQVTTAGLDEFRARLPDCVVHRVYPNRLGYENDDITIRTATEARRLICILDRNVVSG
ncbi:uncharacterized protein LOC134205823 [Armigeres subalbatus]|uniref:uncharacterized protein LOC134205823 n=1 Tax=Armigeres subalbatus TaxID=124917 RepID=UPI002ED5650F